MGLASESAPGGLNASWKTWTKAFTVPSCGSCRSMIRQITPAAKSEIAIGMNTTVLNATDQDTFSVSTAKIEPERGDERGHDGDPDRVVLDRRRDCARREERLVVVDARRSRRSPTRRRSCGRSCRRRDRRSTRRAGRTPAGETHRRRRSAAAGPSRPAGRSPLKRGLRGDAASRSRSYLNAFAAELSSFAAIPLTFFGFFRKSWKSLNSPCPVVAAERGRLEVGQVEAGDLRTARAPAPMPA